MLCGFLYFHEKRIQVVTYKMWYIVITLLGNYNFDIILLFICTPYLKTMWFNNLNTLYVTRCDTLQYTIGKV